MFPDIGIKVLIDVYTINTNDNDYTYGGVYAFIRTY